jgi:hypothetical protein
MLRRQWASKAQLLIATLEELPDANMTAVQCKLNVIVFYKLEFVDFYTIHIFANKTTILINGMPTKGSK